MKISPTRQLAEYIVLSPETPMPDEVVHKAKLWMLDAIGCGLGGSRTISARSAVDALTEWSSGPCRVIGRDVMTDPGTAAFLNSVAINALDYDDCDPSGHPSSTLIGSLLSLAGVAEATGEELLRAYVTGFEVCSRIGQAISPSEARFAEVWGLGTHQTMGAAAVAASLGRLDVTETLNALGIAGASAPVPSGQKWGWDDHPLTWIKDAVALPAQVGVNSMLLAKKGFSGCKDILDGDTGFWRMAASDRCDFELMTRGLGTEHFLLGASVKMYPCCWFIHPTLEAVQRIMGENALDRREIAEVKVHSLTDLVSFFNFVTPNELVDAQFSLPYCVAMVLLEKPVGPDWVLDRSQFTDETVTALASRVRIFADPAADSAFFDENKRIPSRVEIVMTDGRRFETEVPAPKGTPARPVAEQEILDKFRSMAEPVLGRENASELEEFVLTIETRQVGGKLQALTSTG